MAGVPDFTKPFQPITGPTTVIQKYPAHKVQVRGSQKEFPLGILTRGVVEEFTPGHLGKALSHFDLQGRLLDSGREMENKK